MQMSIGVAEPLPNGQRDVLKVEMTRFEGGLERLGNYNSEKGIRYFLRMVSLLGIAQRQSSVKEWTVETSNPKAK